MDTAVRRLLEHTLELSEELGWSGLAD